MAKKEPLDAYSEASSLMTALSKGHFKRLVIRGEWTTRYLTKGNDGLYYLSSARTDKKPSDFSYEGAEGHLYGLLLQGKEAEGE